MIIAAVIIGVFALAVFFAVRMGKFIAHNEQRAYVEHVLHNVETRGKFDIVERDWS